MGFIKRTLPACPSDRRCLQWAQVYLSYCLCSARDGVALSLGLVSVVSWGLAEVPQIITNYREKSAEGLSVAFLMTWIIGDLFNLIGCLLEPATLPTQFYMALLYTATTVILTGQTVYYGHIYPKLKATKFGHHHKDQRLRQEEAIIKEKMSRGSIDERENGSTTDSSSQTSAIPVAIPRAQRYSSGGRDLFYMSARSLSSSPIPTAGSWLAHGHISGRTPPRIDDQHLAREPLLGRHVPAQSVPHSSTKNMLCVVCSAAFFLVGFSFHLSRNNANYASSHVMVVQLGRKLLQDLAVESSLKEAGASSGIGSDLGWVMAAIYMGGRLPQIFLNIRRGNVEGLNPFMFVFALVGNLTYVGSILVSSLEWSKIRPNLPWLVDAGGCVLLDLFIIIQFVYFQYRKPKGDERRENLSLLY